MQSNLSTVRAVFDAFGRGDIEFIVGRLADGVEWEYGVCATEVPWYRNRRGHEGAREFFASLAAVEFKTFLPKAFLHEATCDAVAVLIDSDYVVRATGKLVSYVDAVLLFRFDAEGRIARFAHRVDLTQASRALVAA